MTDLAELQWSLIRGTGPSDPLTGRSEGLVELVEALVRADFKTVFQSQEAQAVLSDNRLYDGLSIVPTPAPSNNDRNDDDDLRTEDNAVRLIVAVALLHAFVQANWTGPDLDFTPLDVIPSSNEGSSSALDSLNETSVPLLSLGGEPAYHLAAQPVLFLLSKRVLESIPADSLVTLSWWRLRLHLVHLSLLDEPIELPATTLDAVTALREAIPEGTPDTLARYHQEIGLYRHALGQDKLANQSFLEASRASGLEFQLTGALGKKTKFQINPLTQLVLLAESRDRPEEKDQVEGTGTGTRAQASDAPGADDGGSTGAPNSMPETLALNDDTLLEETEFTKRLNSEPTSPTSPSTRLSHLDPAKQPPLHPLDQSLLLSLCLSQHNHSPESGLTAGQMMPFVSRVISHPRNWSVHTVALLLRSRLESTRSRTVERSALQLAALIEQMPTSDSTAAERLKYFHQLPLPSRWEMEKELAKRYLSLGVVRSALDIFTRLEMWEDAVSCLQRMERENEAEQIVRDLLEGKKIESDLVTVMGKSDMSDKRRTKLTTGREAKLWCLLGDLALSSDEAPKDPVRAKKTATEYYDRAWEISGETSSRAMRSKGALLFSAREYEEVIPCLRKSLEINPLYARTWFTLGVSLVRLERWSEAREAFQREVGVDDEDAEGWNNLAAVYLRLHEDRKDDESGKSTPFSDKLLAFRALRQGLKFAPTNWRMWSNYMIIALDVGQLSESARAMSKVLSQRTEDPSTLAVDYDVLDKLVDSVTRDDYALASQWTVVPKTSNEGFGLLPIVERLFDESILTRISDSPRVWRAHARLARWKEQWGVAMEDYLRAYRCGPAQSQGVETDKDKFKEAVEEVEELVAVMQALGPRIKIEPSEDGKKKGDWRFQARGLVRTFIGRTRASFEGEPEMERLKELLDELKRSD